MQGNIVCLTLFYVRQRSDFNFKTAFLFHNWMLLIQQAQQIFNLLQFPWLD